MKAHWRVIALGLLYALPTCTPAPVDQAKARFETAFKAGDKLATCAEAGHVADAYLSASDSENYGLWKRRETAVCFMAGMGALPPP